jgi:ribulose 1,5-bisphosphate carboxylase large subunit-like protein
MADGGIDFIKEDEILGLIEICPFEQRIEKVMRALSGYKVIFAPALNAPISQLADNIATLKSYGCPAFHYNVWGGLDAFKYLTDMSDGLFAFYQKSGDKVITSGAFSIDFTVWCKLVRLAGADFIHAGMMGGYLDEDKDTMTRRMEALRGEMGALHSVMPSLSCGATPGMVQYLARQLGDGIMVSAGGCLHGHPMGTYAGAKAFRDAAEGRDSPELAAAIAKWGQQ